MPERYEVIWTRAAIVDLDLLFEYVAEDSGHGRASRLYDKISAKVESLSILPRRGRVVPELKDIAVHEFRELLLDRYRLVYRLDGRKVVLIAILDGRRDLERILVDRALRF